MFLKNLGIRKPMISLYAHNEHDKSDQIIAALQRGSSFALISDAGTPLISDPGFVLVRQARVQNIPVVPIPGACALITALSAAGVPCDVFTFIGFLPAKSHARKQLVQAYLGLSHTLICYESTHRILACLDDLQASLGEEHAIVVAKELTKSHERFIYGNCATVKNWLLADLQHCKGEFMVIIPARKQVQEDDKDDLLLSVLLKELPVKQAVKIASQLSATAKNELYTKALSIQAQSL
jgi:16S rRNA (cytidine1402-2'-O)-methyltransferase